MKFTARVGLLVLMFALSGCSGRPTEQRGATAVPGSLSMSDYDKAGSTGEQLRLAAYAGDVDKAKSLLSGGANVNAADSSGTTPLHLAATYGNVGVAELLVKNGASVNAVDAYGRTPLHLAATWGHTNVVGCLLGNGAAPAMRTARGETPLQAALAIGNHDIIQAIQDSERGRDSTVIKKRGIASE